LNTVEVRACDIPLRAEETVAIAALIQATAAICIGCTRRTRIPAVCAAAADGEQISRGAVWAGWEADRLWPTAGVPERELMEEYLALIDPVVDELGSRDGDRVGSGRLWQRDGRGSAAESF
jgi:carboxylate-amine ligase